MTYSMAVGVGLILGLVLEIVIGCDKTIGGRGGGHANPRSLTIYHRVLEEGAEAVEVTTHIGEEAAAASHRLKEKLERELAQAQTAGPDVAEAMHLWHLERERAIRNAVPPEWRPASFRLDGQAVPGQIARAGDHWAAHLSTDTVVVEMIGSHVDPSQVELTRLLSLDGYG
jgi:hypothetical protein